MSIIGTKNTFMSNMYECRLKINGITYNNAEAAFQSFKLLDKEERKKFSNLTGYQARKLGRTVNLRADWEFVKVEIMRGILDIKFKQNPRLMQELLATGDAEIVEFNEWNDRFWGVCNGRGKNTLGSLLMEIRSLNRPIIIK